MSIIKYTLSSLHICLFTSVSTFLLFGLSANSTGAQAGTLETLVNIKDEHAIIPGDLPTKHTRWVRFQFASSWFSAQTLSLPDFESVEDVEIIGDLSVELSRFISRFPRLKSVYLQELNAEIDLEAVLSPLANSETLRSLEISMVDVAYRDCSFLGKFGQLTELTCDIFFSQRELCALQKLENLQYLNIGPVIRAEQISPVTLPAVRELVLSEPGSIRCFGEDMRIETLRIRNKCSEADILSVAKFSTLRSVDLYVDSVRHLTNLATLDKLETLKISVVPEGAIPER